MKRKKGIEISKKETKKEKEFKRKNEWNAKEKRKNVI